MVALANKYRPKTFQDVVGQEASTSVLKAMIQKGWTPNALMLTGPFGTGKTTLARLIARTLLCDSRAYSSEQKELPEDQKGVPYEPCGVCPSCRAIDGDNNPNYNELDAASNGLVADIREMKDQVSYRSGRKVRVICYDESHMLSQQAQNALLQVLEEGNKDVLFVFCTTEAGKMLPTIRSRCVELNMKLLTTPQIAQRLMAVAPLESLKLEEKAARIMASYVRGHVRDAMVLLEQIGKMSPDINEEMVRLYLRLDKFDELYKFLALTDKKEGLERLETLLCNYAVPDLQDLIGTILVNAYKITIGVGDFTPVDRAQLKLVIEARQDQLLDQAEAILTLRADYATVTYGMAAFANILFEDKVQNKAPTRSLRPVGLPVESGTVVSLGRKPGK